MLWWGWGIQWIGIGGGERYLGLSLVGIILFTTNNCRLYLSRILLYKGCRRSNASPLTTTLFSSWSVYSPFKDNLTFIHLHGVFFMGEECCRIDEVKKNADVVFKSISMDQLLNRISYRFHTVKTRWSWTLCYSGVVQIARNLVHIVA